MLGQINSGLFEKYSEKFKKELVEMEQELANSSIIGSNLEKAVGKCLEIAQNLSSAWNTASFENKQRLQMLVLPEGIVYNKIEGIVRTPRIHSLFALIKSQARDTEENKKAIR